MRVFKTISPSLPPDMLPLRGIPPFSCFCHAAARLLVLTIQRETLLTQSPREFTQTTESPTHLWSYTCCLSQFNDANIASSKMICSILEQHHLRHVALPVDVAVGCNLLQTMAGSWLIRCTKLELECCGKQTVCVFTGDAAVLNQCLLFRALSDFKQRSSHPSTISGKS